MKQKSLWIRYSTSIVKRLKWIDVDLWYYVGIILRREFSFYIPLTSFASGEEHSFWTSDLMKLKRKKKSSILWTSSWVFKKRKRHLILALNRSGFEETIISCLRFKGPYNQIGCRCMAGCSTPFSAAKSSKLVKMDHLSIFFFNCRLPISDIFLEKLFQMTICKPQTVSWWSTWNFHHQFVVSVQSFETLSFLINVCKSFSIISALTSHFLSDKVKPHIMKIWNCICFDDTFVNDLFPWASVVYFLIISQTYEFQCSTFKHIDSVLHIIKYISFFVIF